MISVSRLNSSTAMPSASCIMRKPTVRGRSPSAVVTLMWLLLRVLSKSAENLWGLFGLDGKPILAENFGACGNFRGESCTWADTCNSAHGTFRTAAGLHRSHSGERFVASPFPTAIYGMGSLHKAKRPTSAHNKNCQTRVSEGGATL